MRRALLPAIALVCVLVRTAAGSGLFPVPVLAQGQAGGTTGSMIVDLVANVGTMGFLVWYCWFVTAKAIPQLQQEFGRQLDRVEKSHREEIAELRQTLETFLQQAARRHDDDA